MRLLSFDIQPTGLFEQALSFHSSRVARQLLSIDEQSADIILLQHATSEEVCDMYSRFFQCYELLRSGGQPKRSCARLSPYARLALKFAMLVLYFGSFSWLSVWTGQLGWMGVAALIWFLVWPRWAFRDLLSNYNSGGLMMLFDSSMFELEAVRVVPLPCADASSPLLPSEALCALFRFMGEPNRAFVVVNTHLSAYNNHNQLRHLQKELHRLGWTYMPCVIAGRDGRSQSCMVYRSRVRRDGTRAWSMEAESKTRRLPVRDYGSALVADFDATTI